MSERLPEPGEVEDPTLGVDGPAVPLPDGDADEDEPTAVNDDEEPEEDA